VRSQKRTYQTEADEPGQGSRHASRPRMRRESRLHATVGQARCLTSPRRRAPRCQLRLESSGQQPTPRANTGTMGTKIARTTVMRPVSARSNPRKEESETCDGNQFDAARRRGQTTPPQTEKKAVPRTIVVPNKASRAGDRHGEKDRTQVSTPNPRNLKGLPGCCASLGMLNRPASGVPV